MSLSAMHLLAQEKKIFAMKEHLLISSPLLQCKLLFFHGILKNLFIIILQKL